MNEFQKVPGEKVGEPFMHPVQKQTSGRKKVVVLICLSVFLFLAIGGFLAYKGVKRLLSGVMEKYTDTVPMALPKVDTTEEEAALVLDRFDSFIDGINKNETPPELVMSAREINILLNYHPNWKGLGQNVYVDMENDSVFGQASIPLDGFNPLLRGRFLNGAVSFRVDMVAGRLLLFIDSVAVAGKPLPEEIMGAIRGQNLAEDVNTDPESAAVLQKLTSISVKDGRLIILPKP